MYSWRKYTFLFIVKYLIYLQASWLNFIKYIHESTWLDITIISVKTKHKQLGLDTRRSLFYFCCEEPRVGVVGQKDNCFGLWMETGNPASIWRPFCLDTNPGNRGGWPGTDYYCLPVWHDRVSPPPKSSDNCNKDPGSESIPKPS